MLRFILQVIGAFFVGIGLLLLALWNLIVPQDDSDE